MRVVNAAVISALLATAVAKDPSSANLQAAAQALESAGLVPLIVPTFDPDALLEIAFPQANGTFVNVLSPGTVVAVSDAQNLPVLSLQGGDRDGTFVAVMVDPDAPSREDPTNAQILHFMQSDLLIGEDDQPGVQDAFRELVVSPRTQTAPAAPFMGPAPPAGSGFHRYTLFIFTQPSGFSAPTFTNRSNFDLETFAQANGLGSPIAGTFFMAMNPA